MQAEERLGSFEKFADAIHGVVGCEDIIGSLAAKRFHNSNKGNGESSCVPAILCKRRDERQGKGRSKVRNSRAKKLEFGVGLA